ncbi:hypothetical protein PR001_g1214 [Phytophthora rubi]|uniref:Uncharacterized protein n=2 Tax=Phytophthora rubi TaxID=129364 RepID=A0A6A3PBR9_9STRA|nr:hypothetical protein PR001_g1214 [Phytophthora rubi]
MRRNGYVGHGELSRIHRNSNISPVVETVPLAAKSAAAAAAVLGGLEARFARGASSCPVAQRSSGQRHARTFPKLQSLKSFTMPLSSIVSVVSKNSTSAGTLAVLPLLLSSAGITGYARYAATHAPAENKTSSAAVEHEREEHLHQHVALPWKGTR